MLESSSEGEVDLDPMGPPEKESNDASLDSAELGTKRGVKAIPEQWTRVVSIQDDDLDKLRVFELAPDLLLANAMKATKTRGKQLQDWEPVFWPDLYLEEEKSMKVVDNQLSEVELKRLAIKVSKARKI